MDTNAKEQLERYIRQTIEVRDLSTPQLSAINCAEDYRHTLIRNFIRIGEIARDNNQILKKYWFPLIWKKNPLTEEETALLNDFRKNLLDAYNMQNMDLPLMYRQNKRIVQNAVDSDDDAAIIRALDVMIETSFALSHKLMRIIHVNSIGAKYRDEGLAFGDQLMEYLEKERFATLPDDCKEEILTNARYISALFDRPESYGDEKVNEQDLSFLERALSLEEDSFYREQTPAYHWIYHRFRTLQYICQLTFDCNVKEFTPAQCERIYEHVRAFMCLWDDEHETLSRYSSDALVQLHYLRASYSAGHMDKASYKDELIKLYKQCHDDDFSFFNGSVFLMVPTELFTLLKEDALPEEDLEHIDAFYKRLVTYVQRMPKKDSLSFLLSYLVDTLTTFRPVSDQMTFTDLCQSLVAALHPPTYVHTLSVADLTQCLVGHLIDRNPTLFVGLCDCMTPEEVRTSRDKIVNYARCAALCHDIGKIFVTEEIITYGRALLDEEYELIKSHTEMGAYILSLHEETKAYADIARFHHKWYDGSSGYPDTPWPETMPEKVIISVIACADCMDAATDSIGRSYKEGKQLEEFLFELHEGSGTRYAPYLYELFSDATVVQDVKRILEDGRNENYCKTYRLLASYQGQP